MILIHLLANTHVTRYLTILQNKEIVTNIFIHYPEIM